MNRAPNPNPFEPIYFHTIYVVFQIPIILQKDVQNISAYYKGMIDGQG